MFSSQKHRDLKPNRKVERTQCTGGWPKPATLGTAKPTWFCVAILNFPASLETHDHIEAPCCESREVWAPGEDESLENSRLAPAS